MQCKKYVIQLNIQLYHIVRYSIIFSYTKINKSVFGNKLKLTLYFYTLIVMVEVEDHYSESFKSIIKRTLVSKLHVFMEYKHLKIFDLSKLSYFGKLLIIMILLIIILQPDGTTNNYDTTGSFEHIMT